MYGNTMEILFNEHTVSNLQMPQIMFKYLTFNKVQTQCNQYFPPLFIFKPYVKFNVLNSFGHVIKIPFCKNYIASK